MAQPCLRQEPSSMMPPFAEFEIVLVKSFIEDY